MKKISCTVFALALAGALGCSAALAQSPDKPAFTGFGLGANVVFAKNTVDLNFGTTNLAKDNSEGTLSASYGIAMGKDWVGTVGLSLGLGESSYASYNNGFTTITAKAKEHYAVSFAPGLRVGANGLLYGKLAWHQMAVNFRNDVGFSQTRTFQGAGVGLGYTHALTRSLELNAEYESVVFESRSISSFESARPKQDNLSLGLTYRF